MSLLSDKLEEGNSSEIIAQEKPYWRVWLTLLNAARRGPLCADSDLISVEWEGCLSGNRFLVRLASSTSKYWWRKEITCRMAFIYGINESSVVLSGAFFDSTRDAERVRPTTMDWEGGVNSQAKSFAVLKSWGFLRHNGFRKDSKHWFSPVPAPK